MRDFAEQLFIGALIELFSLILSFLFKDKDKPQYAIIIFAIGTLFAEIVAFFPTPVFLNAKPNTSIVFLQATATRPLPNTQTIILETPSRTPFAITKQVNEWSGILSVRMPTLNEIRAEVPVSIWDSNNLNVRDMTSPGMDSYSGEAQYGSEYLFPVYWCATSSDLLVKNIDNINTVFLVNSETVPEKYVFNYNYDTNTGWKCNYNAIVISGWSANAQYTLEMKRTLLTDLSDGQTSYSSGDYVYRLIVEVR